MLPPRIPLSSGTVSPPPPLPQKPKKLRESLLIQDRLDGVKSFTRPKPLAKVESETESVQPAQISNIGFIGTLMGRRNTSPFSSSSTTSSSLSSSPKTSHKSVNDTVLSSSHSVVSSTDNLSSRSSSPDKDGNSFFLDIQ